MIYSIFTILKYDFIWIYTIIYGLMISYIHFMYYWTKYVILMNDTDKIIIDITFK